jgi:hypothetical protein
MKEYGLFYGKADIHLEQFTQIKITKKNFVYSVLIVNSESQNL